VAAAAAQQLNPALKLRPLQNRVSPDTEDVFDDSFWEGLDLVINALDNVNARLYVDSRCVYFQKPLLESGTLGTKCNTQVVIPGMTENYGAPSTERPQQPDCAFLFPPAAICALVRLPSPLFSPSLRCCTRRCAMRCGADVPAAKTRFAILACTSGGFFFGGMCESDLELCAVLGPAGASRDPPEKQAPMCTLHSFPHNIDHCLTFARSEFEGWLEKAPTEANAYLSDPAKYVAAVRQSADAAAREQLETVVDVLVTSSCASFEDCVAWARRRFEVCVCVGVCGCVVSSAKERQIRRTPRLQ
jgi:ThiF family/Ubiquitin-activating enzyme active site